MPLPPPLTLILATRNAHKVAELSTLLDEVARCLSLKEFPSAPATVEDADSFAGNAAKKAVELARWLAAEGWAADKCLVLADDSGLEVDALGGAPGVQSARFAAAETGAAGNSADAANNAKLLRLLADVPMERRTARFRCVLALAPATDEAAQRVVCFAGVCEGHLEFAPRGASGFGYDPLFVPLGFDRTFAELGEDGKNGLSHRAKALVKCRVWLGANR